MGIKKRKQSKCGRKIMHFSPRKQGNGPKPLSHPCIFNIHQGGLQTSLIIHPFCRSPLTQKQSFHRLPQAPESYQHSLCITRQKGQKWHLSTKLSTIVNKLSILINKVINTSPIQSNHLSVGESTLTHLCPYTQQGMSTPPAPVQLPHSSPKIRAPVGYLRASWG